LGLSLVEHESIDGQNGFWLPFGHYLERDADLLILRRSDGSLVAVFSAEGVDLFEVGWPFGQMPISTYGIFLPIRWIWCPYLR